jgi:glutaminyl-peptide cyclotransferase
VRPRAFFGAAILALATMRIVATVTPPAAQSASKPLKLRAEVIARYAHDPEAFTQGLVIDSGRLFESTGLVGRSSLREVDLATGRVLRRLDVPPPFFSEGLASVNGRLIQLSWQHGRAFVYDARTFGLVGEHRYQGEGWGLCFDGTSLVMSSGSDRLTVRDPKTFAVTRELAVKVAAAPLSNLNELECVGDSVYANVWQTDTIVRIDVRTGLVREEIDASGLLPPPMRAGTDVLNGIAYDPATSTFLITGKLWPTVFRVKFVSSKTGAAAGARTSPPRGR